MANLLVEGVEVEEVMPTLEDQQMVSRRVEASGKLDRCYEVRQGEKWRN